MSSSPTMRSDSLALEKYVSDMELLRVYSKLRRPDSAIAGLKLNQKEEKYSKIVILHVLDSPLMEKIHYFSLSTFSSLRELYLDLCPPSCIVDLHSLKHQLRLLYITNSGIPDMARSFAPHTDHILKHMRPMVMMQESAQPPPEILWSSLTKLRLSNCGLSRLGQPFHLFPSIEYLDVSKNAIHHIIHLQDCVKLRRLNLSHNRLSVISNIGRVLGNLQVLDLDNNGIQSLDGIEKVYALQKLSVAYNLLEDWEEIQHLSQLPCLEAVQLAGNPLSEHPDYRMLVYQQFLLDGTLMSSSRDLPSLDGESIRLEETQYLRSLMFRALDSDQREHSLMAQLASSSISADVTLPSAPILHSFSPVAVPKDSIESKLIPVSSKNAAGSGGSSGGVDVIEDPVYSSPPEADEDEFDTDRVLPFQALLNPLEAAMFPRLSISEPHRPQSRASRLSFSLIPSAMSAIGSNTQPQTGQESRLALLRNEHTMAVQQAFLLHLQSSEWPHKLRAKASSRRSKMRVMAVAENESLQALFTMEPPDLASVRRHRTAQLAELKAEKMKILLQERLQSHQLAAVSSSSAVRGSSGLSAEEFVSVDGPLAVENDNNNDAVHSALLLLNNKPARLGHVDRTKRHKNTGSSADEGEGNSLKPSDEELLGLESSIASKLLADSKHRMQKFQQHLEDFDSKVEATAVKRRGMSLTSAAAASGIPTPASAPAGDENSSESLFFHRDVEFDASCSSLAAGLNGAHDDSALLTNTNDLIKEVRDSLHNDADDVDVSALVAFSNIGGTQTAMDSMYLPINERMHIPMIEEEDEGDEDGEDKALFSRESFYKPLRDYTSPSLESAVAGGNVDTSYQVASSFGSESFWAAGLASPPPEPADGQTAVPSKKLFVPGQLFSKLRNLSTSSQSSVLATTRLSDSLLPAMPRIASDGDLPILAAIAPRDTESSVGGKHRYVGNPSYQSLNVVDNLDLYFREQVFGDLRPSGHAAYMASGPSSISNVSTNEYDASCPNRSPLVALAASGSNAFMNFVSAPPRHETFSSLFSAKLIEMDVDAASDALFPFPVRSQATVGLSGSVTSSDIASTSPPRRFKAIRNRFKASEAPAASASSYVTGGSLGTFSLGSMGSGGGGGAGVVSAASSNASAIPRSATAPSSSISAEVGVPETAILLVLTDVCLYILYADSIPPTAVFSDVPIPLLFRAHPLHHLRSSTIFYGFQRCILQFSRIGAEGQLDDEFSGCPLFAKYTHGFGSKQQYTYQILTRDKTRTRPIVTVIPQLANSIRNYVPPVASEQDADGSSIAGDSGEGVSGRESVGALSDMSAVTPPRPRRNVKIINKDTELIEAVDKFTHSKGCEGDVLHYQMLFQCWRKRPGVAIARTFILTPSLILLCDEALQSPEVQLTVLDFAPVKDISKVVQEEDPLYLTVVIKSSAVFLRKWRLMTDCMPALTRLIEELKKLNPDI